MKLSNAWPFSLLVLFLLLADVSSNAQTLAIGQRDTLYSNILNEDRPLSVYLPPSYHYTLDAEYPVLYILDGDYNFNYVAGLLELWGGISNDIPEMILVGISGGATEHYRKDCTPPGTDKNGKADKVALFLKKELVPYINNRYKTNEFKLLAGHSIGGLFITHTALQHPQLFNHYIAISPALWWDNKNIHQIAHQTLEDNPDFNSSIYMSLADEKGMEVDSFLAIATNSYLKNQYLPYIIIFLSIIVAILWGRKTQKLLSAMLLIIIGISAGVFLIFLYYPSNQTFKFKQFDTANHNSVGEPTYHWALFDIFKTWRVENRLFTSSDELSAHYDKVQQKYGSTFNIPYDVIAYTYFTLKDNEDELQKIQSDLPNIDPNAAVLFNTYYASKLEEETTKAKELLQQAISINPNAFTAYHELSKIALQEQNTTLADSLIHKAMQIGIDNNIRQWQMNELIDTQVKINSSKQ